MFEKQQIVYPNNQTQTVLRLLVRNFIISIIFKTSNNESLLTRGGGRLKPGGTFCGGYFEGNNSILIGLNYLITIM